PALVASLEPVIGGVCGVLARANQGLGQNTSVAGVGLVQGCSRRIINTRTRACDLRRDSRRYELREARERDGCADDGIVWSRKRNVKREPVHQTINSRVAIHRLE